MIYVLDTNVFRKLISHFPKKGRTFEDIWNNLENMITTGKIISVDECYNELKRHYSNQADQFQWIHDHKDMFKAPDNQESLIIFSIFQNPKMRENIRQRNILDNRPSADPYLAAKAKILDGTVVTEERYKPHSAQLPNICEELGVSYISYDDFMEIVSE